MFEQKNTFEKSQAPLRVWKQTQGGSVCFQLKEKRSQYQVWQQSLVKNEKILRICTHQITLPIEQFIQSYIGDSISIKIPKIGKNKCQCSQTSYLQHQGLMIWPQRKNVAFIEENSSSVNIQSYLGMKQFGQLFSKHAKEILWVQFYFEQRYFVSRLFCPQSKDIAFKNILECFEQWQSIDFPSFDLIYIQQNGKKALHQRKSSLKYFDQAQIAMKQQNSKENGLKCLKIIITPQQMIFQQ